MYIVNYSVGLYLYISKNKLPKPMHQILFSSLIILLILIPVFSELTNVSMIFITLSLLCMLLLPLGKKGNQYHIVVSTLGILFYSTGFILNQT